MKISGLVLTGNIVLPIVMTTATTVLALMAAESSRETGSEVVKRTVPSVGGIVTATLRTCFRSRFFSIGHIIETTLRKISETDRGEILLKQVVYVQERWHRCMSLG